MKCSTIVTAFLLVTGLLMHAPVVAAKDRKPIKMRFYVEDGKLELSKYSLWTTRSNCERKDHAGCYYFPANYFGDFTLTLKNGDKDCRRDDAWRFHPTEAVTLGGDAPIDTPLEKEDVAWGNISDEAAADFDASPSSGVVDVTFDGKNKVKFKSENSSVRPYSIWYKVTVVSCRVDGEGNPLETLVYDPRVDNRGNSGT